MSLSDTIEKALALRRELISKGFSGPDLEASFEKTVREAWPKGREWFYNCTACDDMGWEYLQCPGDSTCGPSTWRPSSHSPCPNRPRAPHAAHSYVRVCFCEKGREKLAPISAGEDFSTATKSKPKKKFGRFGNDD